MPTTPTLEELMAVRNFLLSMGNVLNDVVNDTVEDNDPLAPRPGGTGSLSGAPEAALANMQPLPWTPEYEDQVVAKVQEKARTANRAAQGMTIATKAIGVIVDTLLPALFPQSTLLK